MSERDVPPANDLPAERQPKVPSSRLTPGHLVPVVRAFVVWPGFGVLAFALVHGLVFVLADALGPHVHALIDLELWWTEQFGVGVQALSLVAPLSAWILHVIAGRALIPLAVERRLLGVLRWGLLVHPAYTLLDAITEILA